MSAHIPHQWMILLSSEVHLETGDREWPLHKSYKLLALGAAPPRPQMNWHRLSYHPTGISDKCSIKSSHSNANRLFLRQSMVCPVKYQLPTLRGKPQTIVKTGHWHSNAIYVKQDDLILNELLSEYNFNDAVKFKAWQTFTVRAVYGDLTGLFDDLQGIDVYMSEKLHWNNLNCYSSVWCSCIIKLYSLSLMWSQFTVFSVIKSLASREYHNTEYI